MAAAAQSLFVKRPTPLGRYLAISLLLHVAGVGAVLVLAPFLHGPTLNLDQKPITASLVRLGKPRDQKLLPRKEEPPQPTQEVKSAAPAPAEPPKPVASVPDVKPIEARPQPKVSGQKQGESRKSALFGAFDKFKKPKPDEELEGQENGDPNGDAAKAEGDQYWALISAQIKRNYDVSQTISEQERLHLKAQVALYIGRRGEVTRVSLVKTSGNDLFDAAVVGAVRKASPFSPPPDGLRDSLQKTGVVLEFYP
jgi:colicin import membrane protein